MEKLTKTFWARNPRAAFENSSQAESSWTSAEGAKLIEGHRVTMDPKTILAGAEYCFVKQKGQTYGTRKHMSP